MKIHKIRPKFHFLTKMEMKMAHLVVLFCYLLIKNWLPAVFLLNFQRHLTKLTMIFCYWNSIDMVCVEILSDGLKTTYKIVIRLSKLVTLYLAVRLLAVVCLKGQFWVHCYFCFILMICQTVQANYPSESLLMTLICFIQVITA